MVSKAQLRILDWLSNYPDTLRKSWDVTRDLSLPGIADALGVVRSALNQPLTRLEKNGFVIKRTAHVVGGGSRRRQVYHITNEGRLQLQVNHSESFKSINRDRIIGNQPPITEVFGREVEMQHCLEILNTESLLVTGMPGIGKSAFVVRLCQELGKNNTIRWAVADAFCDSNAITNMWFPNETIPTDTESLALKLRGRKTTLVIDDYNLISQRHSSEVRRLVETLSNNPDIRLILISRESSLSIEGYCSFRLDTLDQDSCCMMLGNDAPRESREKIAQALGYHPLAIKMYQPEYQVPESSSDIVQYVETVVLNALSDNQRERVTYMSLEPRATSAQSSIAIEDIDFLDEQNLLSWVGDNYCQLQHLIHNVISSNLTDSQKLVGHRILAEHWILDETSEGLENHLYHLSFTNLKSFVAKLYANLDFLGRLNSAAIASIVSNCIEVNGPNSDLAFIESKIAAYRFEPSVIRDNLEYLTSEQYHEMEFTLAFIEGRISDCDASLSSVLSQMSALEQARTLIMLANSTIEDRLPGESVSPLNLGRAESYLNQIRPAAVQDERQSVVVAMSLIKYSIAMLRGNIVDAENIMQGLLNIGSLEDSIIVHLRTKAELERVDFASMPISELCDLVDANCEIINNKLICESLKLRLVEVLIARDNELTKSRFDKLAKPDEFNRSNTSLRYSARYWLLHSKLFEKTSKSSLRESLVMYREAGCTQVAAQLEHKFHAQF